MADTAFVFDLDGTLVDNVYQHVLAWKQALDEERLDLSVWRIHRKIGISGGLLVDQLAREVGNAVSDEQGQRISRRHGEIYRAMAQTPQPLIGARPLLEFLETHGVPWAIATSSHLSNAEASLKALGVASDAIIVTRDDVQHAKPDPDLFIEAARRLDQPIDRVSVVGDSIWDMYAARRAHVLGIGLLTGGYSQSELRDAGAYRVFADPVELLMHIDELGVRC
jgi:HAD superfamily hydrolase (TIGR01549 family)